MLYSLILCILVSVIGIGSCGVCPNVPTLPPGVTEAPTVFPAECLDIDECSEGNIKYCLSLGSGGSFEACLPLSAAPSIVPRFGECGECEEESVAPATPTGSPSQGAVFPTLSPTGPLDGCEVDPPSCELDIGGNITEGVVFCLFLETGPQVELCAQIEDVQDLLDRGTFVDSFHSYVIVL